MGKCTKRQIQIELGNEDVKLDYKGDISDIDIAFAISVLFGELDTKGQDIVMKGLKDLQNRGVL